MARRIAWLAASLVMVLAYQSLLVACLLVSLAIPWLAVEAISRWLESPVVQILWLAAPIANVWVALAYVRAIAFTMRDAARGRAPAELGFVRLIELVRQVEDAVRRAGYPVRPFHSVELIVGVNAMTTVRWGRRRLLLGWALVRELGERELCAVIAHELAHHLDGSMSFIWMLVRIDVSMARWRDAMMQGMRQTRAGARESALARLFDAIGMLGILSVLATGIVLVGLARALAAMVARRLHVFELDCDRVAARAFGAEVVAGALHRVYRVGIGWPYRVLAWQDSDRFWSAETCSQAEDPRAERDFAALRARATPSHPSLDERIARLTTETMMPAAEPRFVAASERSAIDREFEAPTRRVIAPLRDALARAAAVADYVAMLHAGDADAAIRETVVWRACAIAFELDPNGWQAANTAVQDCLNVQAPDDRVGALVRLALERVELWMRYHATQTGIVGRLEWASERLLLTADVERIDASTSIRELDRMLDRACSSLDFVVPEPYAYARLEARAALSAFE